MNKTPASSTSVDDADIVQRSKLGEELTAEQCAVLADIITTRSLQTGNFLIREGDRDDTLHLIAQGRLEVIRSTGAGEWVTLHVLHEGEIAGELGFIDGLEHSAGLRALSACDIISIERRQFEALIPADPELMYKVMRAIIRGVHDTLRRMNTQYVEMTNYISKQHGRY